MRISKLYAYNSIMNLPIESNLLIKIKIDIICEEDNDNIDFLDGSLLTQINLYSADEK